MKDRNVFDFCNLGNDTVREITLLIKITSSRPKMEIKLETNEELAETIKRVTVPIWLKGQFGVRNGDFQIGSYRYQKKEGAEIENDSNNIVTFRNPPLDVDRLLTSGKFFELKIFVQPSQALFVTNSSTLSLQVFYSDFDKKKDIHF